MTVSSETPSREAQCSLECTRFCEFRFTEGDEFSVVATIDGEKVRLQGIRFQLRLSSFLTSSHLTDRYESSLQCRVGNKKIEAKCAMLHNQVRAKRNFAQSKRTLSLQGLDWIVGSARVFRHFLFSRRSSLWSLIRQIARQWC